MLLAEAAPFPKGLQPWSWPHKLEGSTPEVGARYVCLMRDSSFCLHSGWGVEAPNSNTSMAWFSSSIHCWNLGSRLRDQEGCHGRPLPKNPIHGIPRGVQHLLLSTWLGHN